MHRARAHFDRQALKLLRSPVGRSKAGDVLIVFAATWLFYLELLVAVAAAAQGSGRAAAGTFRTLAVALLAVMIVESISWGISLFWKRERPFVHFKFKPLVWMPPRWKSFPSDHTAIGLTAAAVFLLLGSPFGPLLLVMAIAVGFARVMAGVHYPSDVVAGAVLAALVSWLVVGLTANIPLL